ncbi:phage Gp37/Gp68 family protein [Leptospira noguchii]|uniref:phage Gp37/Gp68 family protein n=1 Tax=Leptospira noguchii TaxID=28182 RepID=UPI001FB75AF5|nr:phage Gp37/Gp68 family protein [Leptospira noguchii]UOG51487.1 phage Gp37/Gp68 family protein [Leptospira noguchii]UOG54762.1 phage Gp37/Gp68 family protein [Leptospira noguchii]
MSYKGISIDENKIVQFKELGIYEIRDQCVDADVPFFFSMNSLLDAYIVDSFLDDIKNYDRDKILSFIQSRSDLQERIIEKKDKSLIFGQPLIILLYMLIEQMPNKVKERWPLTPSELQPLFNDLGIAFDPD